MWFSKRKKLIVETAFIPYFHTRNEHFHMLKKYVLFGIGEASSKILSGVFQHMHV